MDWDTLYCPILCRSSGYGPPISPRIVGHAYLWQELCVTECQLDELWSFVHTKEHNLLTAKHVRETYGDACILAGLCAGVASVLAFVGG